jgi:DNA-binding NtrC family response regulator
MKSCHVFVLDDDLDLVDLLKRQIEQTPGHTMIGATSYADMLTKRDTILKCQIAFLDIDLGLKQPTGIEAHKWLRNNHFTGKKYFLTSHPSTHPLVAQVIAGSFHGDGQVLSKPLNPSMLISLIDQACGHPSEQ